MYINKDQVKGRADEAKGAAKEVGGQVVGSKRPETKGTLAKHGGATRTAVGDTKMHISKSPKPA